MLNQTGQVITWVTSRDVNLGILHGVTATESWSPFHLHLLLPIRLTPRCVPNSLLTVDLEAVKEVASAVSDSYSGILLHLNISSRTSQQIPKNRMRWVLVLAVDPRLIHLELVA